MEKKAFNTRHNVEKHMLIVMDVSIHEQNSCEPKQAKKGQLKLAVAFLPDYKGIFNVTNKNNNFIFVSAFEGAEYYVIIIPPGAYDIKSLD